MINITKLCEDRPALEVSLIHDIALNGRPGRLPVEILRAFVGDGNLEETIIFVGLVYVNCCVPVINREPGYGIYFRFHGCILPPRIAVSQV